MGSQKRIDSLGLKVKNSKLKIDALELRIANRGVSIKKRKLKIERVENIYLRAKTNVIHFY